MRFSSIIQPMPSSNRPSVRTNTASSRAVCRAPRKSVSFRPPARARQSSASPTSLPNSIGDRILCAWKVGTGWVKVQTRSPKFARKLAQRSDCQPAGVGVAGGYLRIYAFNHGMAWAERLIGRYTQKQMPTSEAFLSPAAPPANPNPPGLSGLIPQLELPLDGLITSASRVKGGIVG